MLVSDGNPCEASYEEIELPRASGRAVTVGGVAGE
jgi:hypothetical protein